MSIKPLDGLAILISVLVVGGFTLAAYTGKNASRDVFVEASGQKWIYPLSEDREEDIPGPLGETHLVIRGGKASVADSPCPDKLCVHMPAISQPGQWIACLPNRVFVRIGGNSAQDVDELSY